KIDPTRIRVAEFMQVKGCPLGAALRKRIRREGGLNKEFLCVYSDELLQNKGQNTSCGTEKCLCPKAVEGPGDPDLANHEWCSQKARINGTSSYIPAMFGMTIASLVVMDIDKQAMKQPTLCEKASVSHP
ncbi:MAG TPA: tRNA threonylcarbamoyladenosine dehydratase, partial [Porphyromonadaceae bacterium]|nr:tRNA threonylcarbamoyladenosine dehydratase [Porphyromonadaceae bacterium]